MDDRDKVKKVLSEGLSGIKLSENRKRHMGNSMEQYFAHRRLPLRKRLFADIREFWHSTFEISVAPVALSIAVAASLFFFSAYPDFSIPRKSLGSQTVYLQWVAEQNGTQAIVYMPVETGVNNNANN